MESKNEYESGKYCYKSSVNLRRSSLDTLEKVEMDLPSCLA